MRWYGPEILGLIQGAVQSAVEQCALDLQQKSTDEAPVDTGDLRANCSVDTLDAHSKRVGYNLIYAIIQHERLDFSHPRGGKAKYLEDPFNQNKDRYERYIRGSVDGVTGP